MSVITLDWLRFEGRDASLCTSHHREAEFRSALESYIADYEGHLATATAERDCRALRGRRTLFVRLAQWLRG
jgi:hypothetical protein